MKVPKKKATRSAQVHHIKGALQADHAKIGIVVADFNEYFTQRLLDGALDALLRFGVRPRNIDVFHTPGSFEIPLVVKRALKKRSYNAIITLGMVIKGKTRHFKHVVDAAAAGTLKAMMDSDVPVIHGVVAAENLEQAIDRTGGKFGHKGRDAAKTAIEMANLMKRI